MGLQEVRKLFRNPDGERGVSPTWTTIKKTNDSDLIQDFGVLVAHTLGAPQNIELKHVLEFLTPQDTLEILEELLHCKMSDLLGETVDQIFVSDGESILRLVLKDGSMMVFETEADCCSETWFADLIGVENLIGHQILRCTDLDMPGNVDDGRTRQEVDEAYGVSIKTVSGKCDIIYRNSSNGYYGGWMCSPKRVPYRNWTLEFSSSWIEIKEDWSA